MSKVTYEEAHEIAKRISSLTNVDIKHIGDVGFLDTNIDWMNDLDSLHNFIEQHKPSPFIKVELSLLYDGCIFFYRDKPYVKISEKTSDEGWCQMISLENGEMHDHKLSNVVFVEQNMLSDLIERYLESQKEVEYEQWRIGGVSNKKNYGSHI